MRNDVAQCQRLLARDDRGIQYGNARSYIYPRLVRYIRSWLMCVNCMLSLLALVGYTAKKQGTQLPPLPQC